MLLYLPFAIHIVATPSANSGLTPPVWPSRSGSSKFAPQAVPKATASRFQTHATRGRDFGMSRFICENEDDTVVTFFNNDTPTPVGEG
ncbi:hypothetical protein QR685DRAFT_522029 [Neurospora intermedia]|uniref:Uncharacterized protein n=1 Tax=Neurospora intermedia TaxID=5142 RepID=A0ABR3DIM5_NEUIN